MISGLLSYRVFRETGPIPAALVNVSRNTISSSRSEKHIFFDVDIVVKNKSKSSSSVLLSITSTRHYSFLKHFFSNCFGISSEFAKVFERKV